MTTAGTFTLSPIGLEASLSPAEIERELGALWQDAQEAGAAGRKHVSRVVLGNVVLLGLSDHLGSIRRVLGEIVKEFPCRLFLLEYDPNDNSGKMRAGVNAQCYRPLKDDVPVCCEVVRMVFGPNSARHLRGAVIPLLLPDLQTVLLENLAGTNIPQYAELRDLADRTLTMASMAPSPADGLERLIDGPAAVFDLAWFRLVPIRDQMTAFFDDPGSSLSLKDIKSLQIGTVENPYWGKLSEMMAALMAGWLASRLDWQPLQEIDGAYRFQSPTGVVDVRVELASVACKNAERHLNSIEMTDRNGASFRMLLQEKGRRMDIWCGRGVQHEQGLHMQLSELPSVEALGLALSTPASSKLFRDSTRLAIPILRMLER